MRSLQALVLGTKFIGEMVRTYLHPHAIFTVAQSDGVARRTHSICEDLQHCTFYDTGLLPRNSGVSANAQMNKSRPVSRMRPVAAPLAAVSSLNSTVKDDLSSSKSCRSSLQPPPELTPPNSCRAV
ncbi:hypothetical protein KCU61_g574, partial [Aureobasidium melanogenum]